MKVVYELELDETSSVLNITRAAQLMQGMAALLEQEAAGGSVISRVGASVKLGNGDTLRCTRIGD